MQFQPKSEKELSQAMLAPAGEYDFHVLLAEDVQSKSGKQMIKVKLGIYRGDAMANHVYDYLLPQMESKLRHFCDTTGLLSKYEEGTLKAEDCKGRSGKVRLIIRNDPQYPDKNEVKDYVVRKAKPLTTSAQEAPEPPEDDVPF